jgi:two-component system CheB/CheR fusion protein
MVRNLLSNAMKYTRNGGVLLGCRRRGDKLRIEVWDTGVGIPEIQLQAIFHEFHQVDNPTRELSQGLGLGLAIVRRLGDLLGHAVEVRSLRGRGSVFSIELALAPRGRALATIGVEPELKEVAPADALILIVEDDPLLRYSLEVLARADGYRTLVAADADEAIERATHAKTWPDLVILDINLPRGPTGLQVMARLRELAGRDLPALVLTGDISAETLGEIARQGFAHRAKPMRGTELSRLIRTLLAARRSEDSNEALRRATIFVVDDDAAVREALRGIIEAGGRPVEVYGGAREFLGAWVPVRNGCLVVDCRMPGMDGIELLEHLKAEGHQLPAIMITGYGDVPLAIRAIKAGAASFIQKPVGADELLTAIGEALERAHGPSERASLNEETTALIASLTPRERQVMERVIEGLPNKQIAHDLGISQRTVENHRAALMKKLGARSLSQLIRLTLEALPSAESGSPH